MTDIHSYIYLGGSSVSHLNKLPEEKLDETETELEYSEQQSLRHLAQDCHFAMIHTKLNKTT
jgi:hypothetical protein